MDSFDRTKAIVSAVVETLKQEGAFLTEMSLDSDDPTFKVVLDKSKMIKPLDDTLFDVYGVLKVLVYGSNGDSLKINLKYSVVQGGFKS